MTETNTKPAKAVVAVFGRDAVGILAKVSGVCADVNVNVTDVTQTVMQEMFVMTMMTDITACSISFGDFSSRLKDLGKANGLEIHVMHEDIFNSMHRI
jgi:ACT domain-containing protein